MPEKNIELSDVFRLGFSDYDRTARAASRTALQGSQRARELSYLGFGRAYLPLRGVRA
jgi:hypothetical protein